MKISDTDNQLRRVKEEIARARQTSRPAAAPKSMGAVAPARAAFTIDELASFHFIAFIENAYASLLRRAPDSTGLNAQICLLEAGRSKIEILGNLRYSGEGRAIGVRVPGLWPRYFLAKSMRVPILGYAIEWLMCLGGLPRMLRHQRAADAYHAAHDHVIGRDLASLAEQLHPLRDETLRLEHGQARLERGQVDVATQLQQFGERFGPVRAEIEKSFHEIRDLRQLVLSINHWLASLRENLATLETAEAEQARKAGGMHADVSEQLQQFGERFTPVRAEIEKSFHEIRDLRHLVLSMNHWLASLRQNLAALETAEAEQARKAGAMHADVAEQLLKADQRRPIRLEQWAATFTKGLSASAEVLDIGGGLDWLQALSRYGLSVTTINSNIEIGQRIRDAGITIAVAEPSVVLARIGDQTLDGVTILDLAALLRGMPAVILLDILRRMLRPGGQVLFSIGPESATITDRLEGRGSALVDGDLIERALQVSGFVEIRRIASVDGSYCVVAGQAR